MADDTEQSAQRTTGHQSIEGTLSVPLLQFDLAAEIEKEHTEDSWSSEIGRSSKTLVKHDDLRIVLTSLKAKTRLHEHKASARISIQTLTGHIVLRVVGRTVDLPAGHLLVLDQCLPHDVEAMEDSSFLLTLSWPTESNATERGTKQG
jgi:quercetin dioxygenase-like cupin family protein